MLDFDMLGASMELGILGESYGTLIVIVDYYSLGENGFISGV